jgi:hypothetical protein
LAHWLHQTITALRVKIFEAHDSYIKITNRDQPNLIDVSHAQTTLSRGGKVELVFSVDGKNAVFTEYANENTDNALSVMKLFNAGQTNDMLTFWGFDVDGKAELITLYPKLGKGIWTTHNDRISFVDRLALSKSLMMDCIFKKLGD